jgi:hypothetical protein
MDDASFDRLARILGSAGTRRSALGAALGAAMIAGLGVAEAKKGRGRGRVSKRRRGETGRVSAAAADCFSPGPGSNLNRCNFDGQNLAGVDLSSSSMVGTSFRGANLCGADLSSSQLRNADFRGLPLGMTVPTNLTLADLSSSGCRGTRFDAYTVLCRTKTCNGVINNRDCPDGIDPRLVCCTSADCGIGQECARGRCQGVEAERIGVTEVTADGVRLVSDVTAAETFGGLEFRIGAAVDFAEIVRLEAVYNSEVAPGCRVSGRVPGAGSPRFELRTAEGDVYVSFAPENDCPTGPRETGNLIGNDEFALYDTSRIVGGREFATYSEARDLLRSRELAVTRVRLVADGGEAGNPQRVVVRPRVEVARGGTA